MRVLVPRRTGDPTVSISLLEEIHSLTNATKLLPARRGGRPPHVSCLFRWAKHGLRGVKLEVLKVGGTTCTSRQELERFFARLTETEGANAGRGEIPGRRKQEMEQASRQAREALQ